MVKLNGIETHGLKHFHSCLETFVSLKVIEFSSAGHDVEVESWGTSHTNPFAERLSISLRYFLLINKLGESKSELMLAVVLPYASEVRLVGDLRWHLVWEDDVILFQNFRSKFAKSIPFFLELFTTFCSSFVNSENNWLILITVGERVKNSVSLAFILGIVKHVTAVSPSGGVGNFIIEESCGHTCAPLFKSEPLKHIWLLTLTGKLSRGPLRVEVSHSVGPCLS